MHKIKTPFLWNFISDAPTSKSSSGGQERPVTGSLAEENRHALAEFS